MNLEINELQNFYTNTLLGSFCSKNISTLIKKNEAFIVRENFNQENIVGYGYPIPYLDNLIKKNSNYLCLMPKNQGALNWPSKKNKTIMPTIKKPTSHSRFCWTQDIVSQSKFNF